MGERSGMTPERRLLRTAVVEVDDAVAECARLEAVEGNARLSRADPVQTVQALKEEDGGPIGVGGADLAATLTAHQLIDEYHLFVNPVAIGGGKPFFADHTRVNLEFARIWKQLPKLVFSKSLEELELVVEGGGLRPSAVSQKVITS